MEILEALKKLQNEGRKHNFETIFGKIYKENVCFILGRKRYIFEHLGGGSILGSWPNNPLEKTPLDF